MAEQKLGLYVIGQVISKNRYPAKDNQPERFSIDVASPGVRELLNVKVDPVQFGAVKEMDTFQSRLSMRTYKGAVYFEAVPVS